MKRQQPIEDDAGSHAVKVKKKPGCLGWLARIIGGFLILFVGAAALSGLAGAKEDPAEPEPTATSTPAATTPAPEPTVEPAPVEEPPATVAPAPEPPAPEPPAPVAPPVVEEPPAPAEPAPFMYPNCPAVEDANAAPIFPGDPGWNPRLDADGDGQACGDDK